MNKYENAVCPVCGERIEPQDLVVCPDCGTAHHRACYNELSHCFFEDKHGEMPTENEQQEHEAGIRCPNCGAEFAHGNVCPNCNKVVSEEPLQYNDNVEEEPVRQENPFFTRNGFDENELIDGKKLADIARFVGYNALRYIRIFKRMSSLKSKISWNWLAFLVPDFWLISRKCYGAGILMGFFRVLTNVLVSVSGGDELSFNALYGQVATPLSDKSMYAIGAVCVSMIVVSVFTGLFGDYIYKKHVYSSLDTLIEHGATDEFTMIRAGGVNILLPIMLYFGVNVVTTVLIALIR